MARSSGLTHNLRSAREMRSSLGSPWKIGPGVGRFLPLLLVGRADVDGGLSQPIDQLLC